MRELSKLPDGWRVVRLEDVAHVNPRRPKLKVQADLPTSFIPMAAVRENCQGITAYDTRPYHEIAKGYTYFESNDVLFAKITPCLQNGKHALAAELANGFGFGTTEFHVVRPGVKLDPKHLYRVLTQPRNILKCINSFTGTAGQQRVQPEVLRSLIVLLPPISEQRAIAAVLDAIDKAIERTEAVISATERLRDALLHELLTRGVPGWHTKWRDVPRMGRIPEDWEGARLGEVCRPPQYGAASPARPYDPTLPRYVRITDLTEDGRLRSDDPRSADPPAVAGYGLRAGDLLFARSGATVGKTYLYRPEDGPCVFAGYLIRFRVKSNIAIAKFIDIWTRSSPYRRWVASMLRAGAQPNINAVEYSSLPIPLPPLREQRVIVGVLNAIDAAVECTHKELSQLRSSKLSISDVLLDGRLSTQLLDWETQQ